MYIVTCIVFTFLKYIATCTVYISVIYTILFSPSGSRSLEWIFRSFLGILGLTPPEMSINHRSGSGVAALNPSERGKVQRVQLTPLLFRTWNCNGLNEKSVIIVAEEGCDVLGLTETHNCSVDRYVFSKDRLVSQGQIAFVLGRRAADSVIAVMFPHERLGYMCIAGHLRNLLVFCCYMHTSSHSDQQEELYLLLTRLMRGCGSDIITLGDFNTQLGRTPPAQRDIHIGWWGVQKRDNDAGSSWLTVTQRLSTQSSNRKENTWQPGETPAMWRTLGCKDRLTP